MSSNNVKTLLKEAREAINKKDYQTSLKLCKNILRQDKENYMCLVFLGVSLQETGVSDQAKKAFSKAIDLNSENVLAWNALLSYYEKFENDFEISKLIEIYLNILKLETNDKKIKDICEKLESIKNIPDVQFIPVVTAVYKSALFLKEQNSNARGPWATILEIVWNKKNTSELSEEILQILEDALFELVHKSQWMNIDIYSKYLKILYQKQNYEILLKECERMHLIFEENPIPLEWVCKTYNELEMNENEQSSIFEPLATEYYKILQKMYPKSVTVLFTNSLIQYKYGNFILARDILKEVTSIQSDFLHSWILLVHCYVRLSFFEEALKAFEKVQKLIVSSSKNISTKLQNRIFKLHMEILSKHPREEYWQLCIENYKEATDKDDTFLKLCLLRSFINLNRIKEAKNMLEGMSVENDVSFKILEAKLLQKEGKTEEALNLLLRLSDCTDSDFWFQIGLLYWEIEDYDKSAVPFLKAAKFNPNNYLVFLYLGHFYKKFNNIDKAQKCYEKAFKMNKNCIDAALELSSIYREQKDWESNLELLRDLTGGSVNDSNDWAWVQLGVAYLEKQDFERAIGTWRYLARCKPNNGHFWEGLADSYLARGSHTSALKCYEKAAELSPNSLYPILQIANMKKVLGKYADAYKDFENILATNQTYVPALKGLAETCLNQAKLHNKNQLIGLARDCCQYALDNVLIAINQNNGFSCLWKLAADSCYFVAQLPDKYCCLLVSSTFITQNEHETNKCLERDELYLMAAKYYSNAIYLTKNNIFIWHDLASCYLSYAKTITDHRTAKNFYDKALIAVQHCTKENPTHWEHWNLLGNVAISKEPKNYSIAQHAFIKAVTVDNGSSEAWTNLGCLYLKLELYKLANYAFSKAQRADPTYVNSWVGQALIAENMKAEEAMDLFRHSTQLGMHMQGALGYGHWVCNTLINSPPHNFIYAIHKMHAIPVACDALTWYVERNPYDSCAWNMLGLLRERMNLKRSTLEAFKKAFNKCTEINKDKAKVNMGRILFRLGKYNDSIEYYENVKEANFKSGSGLALARFKAKKYEESYETYESALHWLTDEQSNQSDILVALASMAYSFQGPEAAKTLLFQSVKCNPPSPFAFYAILALGLLHEDLNLAEAAIKEIHTLKDKKEFLLHTSVLLSHFYSVTNKVPNAIRELSKLIHRHPDQASLWLSFAMLFIRFESNNNSLNRAATRCAQVAVKVRQTNEDIKKTLCIVSLLCSIAKDENEAVKAAQKAVFSYPDLPECWCILIFTSLTDKQKSKTRKTWLKKIIQSTQEMENVSSLIQDWLKSQEIFIDNL